MKVNIYIPAPALQPYVLTISTVDAELPAGMNSVVTPYPPTAFQSMIFYCNNPVSMARVFDDGYEKQPQTVIIGPQYSRVNIKVEKRLKAIRVDFVPGGLYRMLGISMHELYDAGFDAEYFYSAVMKHLNEQLRNTDHLSEGKNIVEKFLLDQLVNAKQMLPIDAALQILLTHNGDISIEKIAALSCLSLKQFERKCKERLGMNPKLYARILKFSKAYRIHEAFPEQSWTSIAYEAGYYDQMHMIRDFKIFAGVNPSMIERQLRNTPLRMQKDLTR